MEMELDLKKIFSVLLSKLKYIIIIAVLIAFLAFGYTKFFVTPMYTSTAKFLVLMEDSTNKMNEATYVNEAIYSYIELFGTTNFYRGVAEDYNEKYDTQFTPDQMKAMTSIQSSSGQNAPSFTVQIRSADPKLSYNLANIICNSMKELSALEKYNTLNEIDLIDDPQKPIAPSSPSVVRNTVLACFLGGICAAAVFVIISLFDKKIKNLQDITSRYKIPVLGVVPDSSVASIQTSSKLTKEDK